jgi:hypothetical protein
VKLAVKIKGRKTTEEKPTDILDTFSPPAEDSF